MSARPLQLLVLIAAALGASHCAFEPGQPFATASASFAAPFEALSDRELGQGWQQLNTDFQVRIDTLELSVDALELVDSGGSTEVSSFDPANPPAGYSLCHSGHCHRDDGALVDYEDIAAELAAGDPSAARTVITFSPIQADLLPGAVIALSCESRCDLPEGYLLHARLTANELVARGLVRDGRSTPRIEGEQPWQVDLSLLQSLPDESAEVGSLIVPLGLEINEDEPPRLALAFRLVTDTELFDDLPFTDLWPATTGTLNLNGATGAAARSQLLRNFADYHLSVDVQRTEDD